MSLHLEGLVERVERVITNGFIILLIPQMVISCDQDGKHVVPIISQGIVCPLLLQWRLILVRGLSCHMS